MNQAYLHTSYTPTQFANHSSRTTREQRPRNSNQAAKSRNKVAGVRGEFDEMMGYLCLCPPAVCRPSALTYSCRPRSSDADNLRILLSNGHIALVHRRTTSTTSILKEDLIDQLHLDMGRIYATLRSSHGLASSRRWRVFRRPHGRGLSAPSRWCTASPPQSQRGGVLLSLIHI